MDPNLKLVLEEIQKSKEEFGRRFDDHNEQWERRFADLDLARAARDAAVDKRLDAIELAGADTAYTIGRRVADLEAFRLNPLHDERDDRVTPRVEAVASPAKDEAVLVPGPKGSVGPVRR
jgi:hypothetical protein